MGVRYVVRNPLKFVVSSLGLDSRTRSQDPVSDMVEKIDQVTPEAVQRVANRIFGPESGRKHRVMVVTMGHKDVGNWQGLLGKYGVSAA